jgi:MFS transporter, PAT family, solute carrier family 33 (acetyl-CoA transportor), member 1
MDSRKKTKNIVIDEHEKSNLSGDYGNIAVLLLLYTLQGIPLGCTYAIPLLLQNRGVSYSDQAAFSFAFYPFTGEKLI